jgi:hypothetical protein
MIILFELEQRNGLWKGNVIIDDIVSSIGPVDDKHQLKLAMQSRACRAGATFGEIHDAWLLSFEI